MTRLVSSQDAARRLGVEPATLYAYVSRGLLSRQRAMDGRTSLYAVEELEALAARGRRRPAPSPPSVDVQIATSVTEIGEGHLHYRGLSVPDLAMTASFEQVAELLWTGTLPHEPVVWPVPPPSLVRAARDAAAALGPAPDCGLRLTAMVATIASHDPLRGDRSPEAVSTLGRRLLATLVRARHPANRPAGDSIAAHLAASWTRDPSAELIAATDRALVLLADHELASSTLGVRVAASTWADPYAALVSGLGVMSGPLHGAAGRHVAAMLERCAREGVHAVIGEYLRDGMRVPGFGHQVYRGEDPRVAPLMEAVRRLGHASDKLVVVDDLLRLTAMRLPRQPNVDFALGAMAFVSPAAADTSELFSIARIAGWLAHTMEEYAERPVRFRANGRYVGRVPARSGSESGPDRDAAVVASAS